MRTLRRSDPAVIAWVSLVVAALGIDVWCYRKGHRLLTEVARTPVGRVARGVVELHLDQQLGRYDPFSMVANRLTPAHRPPADG